MIVIAQVTPETSRPSPSPQRPPVPQPVPVSHSPSYLLRNRRQASQTYTEQNNQEVQQKVSKEKNAIAQALASLDEHLNEIEKKGPGNAGILYNFTSSSAGQATVKGLQAATEITFDLGKKALKIAGPLSQKVLAEGIKFAGKAVAEAEKKSNTNYSGGKQKEENSDNSTTQQ
eukprot:TRINITY_DN1820_c0_g1_i2.p4 TRINITY_DN1820_c0_g1~~TRINITY_DN1820_c0_g1_i2.p4  ORF type:complete len:173 (+),score=24.84 TRINITY_DN1820_c0_g1_i2:57-575(+)